MAMANPNVPMASERQTPMRQTAAPIRWVTAVVLALSGCSPAGAESPPEAASRDPQISHAAPLAARGLGIAADTHADQRAPKKAAGEVAPLAALAAKMRGIAQEAEARCATKDAPQGATSDCAAANDAMRRAREAAGTLAGLAGHTLPDRELGAARAEAQARGPRGATPQDGVWVEVGRLLAATVGEGRRALAAGAAEAGEQPRQAAQRALDALDQALGGQVFQRPGSLPAGAVDPAELAAIHARSLAKRQRYAFTNSWFDRLRVGWEEATVALRGRPLAILEVGAFEGAATTWFLDELAGHPDARVTAVDTFRGSMELQPGTGTDYALDSLRRRFDANVARAEHGHRLRVMAMTSQEALRILYREGARFDFVYIDAAHTAQGVLADAVDVWPLLKVGGTLVFDDFEWQQYVQDIYNPRLGITAFLQCFSNELRHSLRSGQIWAFRTLNGVTPIRR